MQKLVKLILILVVVGIVLQQAGVYYSTIIVGNYITNASFGMSIMAAVAWPLAVLAGAFTVIRWIIKADFNKF